MGALVTEALIPAVDLGSTDHAGYRLAALEVFNWGTFDKRVWRLALDGEMALLTGDIGSGKSTLVDALTTLLLPASKISYNKAAGAQTKERTLRSYVQGHYKSESVESTGTSRPVGLRDHSAYSVILGVFRNDGYDETVTLAQVFHQKDRTGQPDRFYVVSPKSLAIESDFTDFGTSLVDLRRRLRAAGAQIYNHGEFPKYAAHFRKQLGIGSEQAMDLFHQTVSMKSVGNLNDFVRTHMLEPVDTAERVRAIISHFENLTTAHEAVRRARDQLAGLEPLVATADRYDAALERRGSTENERDAVRLFFTELRVDLLRADVTANTDRLAELALQAEDAEADRDQLRADREDLIDRRARAGGDRLGELERLADAARGDAQARGVRRARFDARVAEAGLARVVDAAAFVSLSRALSDAIEAAVREQHEFEDRRSEIAAALSEIRRAGDETRAELSSLASRRSNLPRALLTIREEIGDDLGLGAEDLPFAGELLDVTEEFAQWRGAAERVLRGFALSLLVPQDHYDRVSAWVNERQLTHRRNDGKVVGSRLVYERVAPRRVPLQPAATGGLLLADTIEIADTPLRDYLRNELARRADYRCVDSITEFRVERRAVTRAGQVRSGDRHEKDDRSRADDPRTWVLGWTNERKVEALTAQLSEQQQHLLALDTERGSVDDQRRAVSVRGAALAALREYPSWLELNAAEALDRAASYDAERARLVSGSSALAEIERQLTSNADHTRTTEDRLRRLHDDMAKLDDRIDRSTLDLAAGEELVAAANEAGSVEARAAYPALQARIGDDRPGSAEACRTAADRLSEDLDTSIKRINTEIGGYTQSLLQYMTDFRRAWPEATAELDSNVDARHEYRGFHDHVARDDLPRFEAEFKRQLNTETIKELAQFNSWLKRQAEDIDVRVRRINEALGAIDYSPGRYISLVTEATVNQEVRDFRGDLRNATTDILTPDDDHYSEQRFLDVARIIERLRGREGHTDVDRAWSRRVTDVRNWFTFSASERTRDTNEEWERYRDSDGKSGGQKEKLAYTILAASLAYQFGLEWGVERSRDFRFAVIDEAFGRGSDVSTRYALDLFARLGLQLLIVTPLQKVHVIEPYVRAIGFVDNPDGNYSRIQTLTIEEYRAQRAERT